jgi:hypothetical protein
VLALAERWGLQGRRHRAATTRGGPAPEVPGRGRTGLVDELAPAMERLAAAGLPIVSACNLIGYAGC